MPRSITDLPNDDRTNGWSALAGPRQPRPSLQGDLDVDWVIVGAGYAGLAAARQLALQQPDATIAVVEAGVVGENASGRNSVRIPANVTDDSGDRDRCWCCAM